MSKKTFEVLGTSDHFEKYQSNVDTNWNLALYAKKMVKVSLCDLQRAKIRMQIQDIKQYMKT